MEGNNLQKLLEEFEDLKSKVLRHDQLLTSLVNKKINVHEEFRSRGFLLTEENLTRCTNIVKEYRGLTFKELREVLDHMSEVNDAQDIRDVPAYFYAALRKKYWHKHQDYNPQIKE